jgi:hypothetical protein
MIAPRSKSVWLGVLILVLVTALAYFAIPDYFQFWIRSLGRSFSWARGSMKTTTFFVLLGGAAAFLFIAFKFRTTIERHYPQFISKISDVPGLRSETGRTRSLFVVLCGGYVIAIGPYAVYKEAFDEVQHEKSTNSAIVKEREEFSKPKLNAEMAIAFRHGYSNDGKTIMPERMFLLMEVIIKNTGAPSVVDAYAVVASMKDLSDIELPIKAIHYTQVFRIMQQDGSRKIYNAEQWLPDRTSTPIPTGGQAVGFLLCPLPESFTMQVVTNALAGISLTYRDVEEIFRTNYVSTTGLFFGTNITITAGMNSVFEEGDNHAQRNP